MSSITIPDNELTSFDLPRVCVMTGATSGVVFKPVKFQWYPRWVPILVLVNVLIAAIVALALTRRVKGELPFTEEGHKAWKLGSTLFALSIVAAIALMVGCGIFLAMDQALLAGLCGVATLAVPIAVWVRFARGKTIRVLEIADGKITLDIPSDSAALALKTHLRGGLAVPTNVAA